MRSRVLNYGYMIHIHPPTWCSVLDLSNEVVCPRPPTQAAELVLDGRLGVRGVRTPSDPGVTAPLLEALGALGIRMVDRVTRL